MDGWEVARAIREDEELRAVELCALTGTRVPVMRHARPKRHAAISRASAVGLR